MGILQIEENVYLNDLHTSSFPLSILQAYEKFSAFWLLNLIIPISFEKKFNNVLTYDFPYFWRWDCFDVKFPRLLYKTCCLEFMKKQLLSDYYMFISVNEKYIPNRYAYQRIDYMHDLLVYGYDKQHREFMTIAYNEKAQYTTQIISEYNIYQSFVNSKEPFCKCCALRPKTRYDFNYINYKKISNDLLNYYNPLKKNKGFLAYEMLIHNCYPNKKYEYAIDLRSFRMMRDRANLFFKLQRVLKITKNTNYIEENMMISKLLLNLAIKYNTTNNYVLINKIHKLIEAYSKNEFGFLKYSEFYKKEM